MKLAHSLVDAIFSTPNSLPTALRDLFAYLQVEVMKRFPEMKDRVVGGFFFLRFVCPALLSPEQWGIVDGRSPPYIPIFSVGPNRVDGRDLGAAC